jgi:hypothetical protein
VKLSKSIKDSSLSFSNVLCFTTTILFIYKYPFDRSSIVKEMTFNFSYDTILNMPLFDWICQIE